MGNTIQLLEEYELLHVNSISPRLTVDSLRHVLLCARDECVLDSYSFSLREEKKCTPLCLHQVKGTCWKSTENKLFHGNFFHFFCKF